MQLEELKAGAGPRGTAIPIALMGHTMKSSVVKHSIVINGHRTSLSLEDAFWCCLREIARQRGIRLKDLVGAIETGRQQPNLPSTLRLFVLEFFRNQVELKKAAKTAEGGGVDAQSAINY